MFLKASRAIIAGRWLSVVFWIILAAVLVQVAPNLQEEANTSQQESRSRSSLEAFKASELIAEKFPDVQEVMNNQVTVTLFRDSGLTTADQEYGKALEQFLSTRRDDIRLESTVSPFSDPQNGRALLSTDGKAALVELNLDMTYATDDNNEWLNQTKEVIPRIRNHLSADTAERDGAPAAPAGLDVHLTGGNAIWGDVITLQEESLNRTLVMTLVFILVVLLVIYRSPVAAIFPLISVVLALTISQGVLGIAADAGLPVSPNALVFLIIVLFGLGTDHSLLMFSRFRDNLLDGRDKLDALRSAVTNGGEAIFSSACAVIVAFGAMFFATDANFKGIGPPLAIAVAIEFLVIMTLIPAAMAILGEKVFWPFQPAKVRAKRLRQGADGRAARVGIWERIAGAVTSRPNRFIAITLIALIPFIGLLAGFRFDNNELRALLPTSTDSYQGLTVQREHYGEAAGAENAVSIIIESERPGWDDARLATLRKVGGDLDALPGVSSVTTPDRSTGPGFSADGTSVSLSAMLADDPYSQRAMDTVTEMRETLRQSLRGTDLAGSTAYVGGVTAEVRDNLATQKRDFLLIATVVLIGILLILALLLRSLVAPLYMAATIVVAYAATMGLTVATFQYGFGYSGLWIDAPVAAFVILVALGIDYSIFLMTRVKEEYRNGRQPTREAVRKALASTGSVITSCGIILAGTFTPLLFSGIKSYVEMGFAIVVGLLLDTFVIRTLLVPAIAVKVGERNWWPRRPQPVADEVTTASDEVVPVP
ncbi:MMPL family transporter [Micromonospora mirobrigensis]|uniref:Putative drug exporter of the RND superfamily n=1 Tax=Micromonospora mirobrigensis TaxID=262898 RepID=A0A1C4V231_9ACTN|nr:MMPL family transporter [Micromonospora mirobrigensis]SCE78130.1 putative drug exporter of the RND superfamily [Micromonospora mirobrigensis]